MFDAADLIVKVKEPQPQEIAMLRAEQTLFTYLHLAADPEQARGLMASGATCIAYETVTDDRGGLPLLKPMSEVAGRMSVQVGAHCLEREQGGRGVLLGGVPGVPPGRVIILGGGVAGVHAAEMASGLRADVTIYDISAARLAELDQQFAGRVKTAFSTKTAIAAAVREADHAGHRRRAHPRRGSAQAGHPTDALKTMSARCWSTSVTSTRARLFRDLAPHNP